LASALYGLEDGSLISGRASRLNTGLDAGDQTSLLAVAGEVGEGGASVSGESGDEAVQGA